MIPLQLLQRYERLVEGADESFRRMESEYGANIRCERHCADCCHAVFGLFFIEAAYIQQRFDEMPQQVKGACLERGLSAERSLRELQETVKVGQSDPEGIADVLARGRIRCPLLDDNHECVIYPHRPITCRVYGIPTRIQGRARVCGKAGFKKGKSYPAFDLDGVYRSLYLLSEELLRSKGHDAPEKATLLISVSKAIRTPLEDLINGNLEECDKDH